MLKPIENYAAKHLGLIPVRFVTCRVCGKRAGWSLELKCCVVCSATEGA